MITVGDGTASNLIGIGLGGGSLWHARLLVAADGLTPCRSLATV